MHKNLWSPRWTKMMRDVEFAKGRVAMMVLAIALGVLVVTTILSAYASLTREVSRNYLATLPAAASLEMESIDADLLAQVRQQPGIAAAEARATLRARIEVKKDNWLSATFFVIEDFKDMQLSRFTHEVGEISPSTASILLEREALKLSLHRLGETVNIKTQDGVAHSLNISGVVHDPSLAPAWQEQNVYAYITPATLNLLNPEAKLKTLKVLVRDDAGRISFDQALIDTRVAQLATWLNQQGHKVNNIRIPPAGLHPHQGQMTGVLLLLLVFSFTALFLSAVLTATMVRATLAQQIRQIGVMKAIGASAWQITQMYLIFVFLVGAIATLLALPLGLYAGGILSNVGAQLFNINLLSKSQPWWVYTLTLACGVVLPMLLAWLPIAQATKITVREAISDFGIHRGDKKAGWFAQSLARFSGLDRSFALALRNVFRHPGRLTMNLLLLASSGALFIGTISVKNAWEDNLVEAAKDRHYDVKTVLNQLQSEANTLRIIQTVPGVKIAESWKEINASKSRPDGLLMERTYPDGGHGSLSLITVPRNSKLIDLQMLRGRWLQEQELNTVVLNNAAFNYFGQPQVGSDIALTAAGKTLQLRLVGVAREIMTGAQVYINQASHDSVFGENGGAKVFRIALKQHDADFIQASTANITATLEQNHIATRINITEMMLGTALDEHTSVLIVILMLMSILMAGVGALGLASSMGTSVVERTREFGIMRAIGGRSNTILKNLIGEGILIGVMSWCIAAIASLPIALCLGLVNSGMNADLSLPILFSSGAAAVWLLCIVVISIAASFIPARRATQMSIRETLSFI